MLDLLSEYALVPVTDLFILDYDNIIGFQPVDQLVRFEKGVFTLARMADRAAQKTDDRMEVRIDHACQFNEDPEDDAKQRQEDGAPDLIEEDDDS